MINAPPARPADAERDLPRDLVHHARHVDFVCLQWRARRFVAAPNIPADAAWGDVVLVRSRPADRHRITDMVIRTKDAEIGFDEAALELFERSWLRRAEDFDLRHQRNTSAPQPAIRA